MQAFKSIQGTPTNSIMINSPVIVNFNNTFQNQKPKYVIPKERVIYSQIPTANNSISKFQSRHHHMPDPHKQSNQTSHLNNTIHAILQNLQRERDLSLEKSPDIPPPLRTSYVGSPYQTQLPKVKVVKRKNKPKYY